MKDQSVNEQTKIHSDYPLHFKQTASMHGQ